MGESLWGQLPEIQITPKEREDIWGCACNDFGDPSINFAHAARF
jgi:hypothetical protein